MPSIKICEAPSYSDDAYTKVTTMGNVVEVVTMGRQPMPPPVQKVDKDHYVDLRTGVLFKCSHIENRAEDFKSVKRTLANIRALINTNVTKPENVRWVTLTYKENMTDAKRLYEDFRRFWQKFVYWCSRNGHGKPEYITVQEPQGRGAWHVHAFFIWDGPAPYIDNNTVMAQLWGHGFTKTKALDNVDNAGAYFSAYLADMPVDEFRALPQEQQAAVLADGVTVKTFTDGRDLTKEKKFVKGGRLCLYPPGMNIVRKTKGIKLPTVEHMPRSEARKKVSSAKLTFSRAVNVLDDSGAIVNVISKEYYNNAAR